VESDGTSEKIRDSQTCRYNGQIYFHWYKILGLLYKRALFDLQFVWYFVKPFIIIAPHEPFTRKSNGPCVTEVQCTLQRGELALCTNNRIRGQSIARLKLPVDIALKRKQVLAIYFT
jgi:hypothetical protein